MKVTSAIRYIKYFNTWRQGADIRMPAPKRITEALNNLIIFYKNKKNNDFITYRDDLARLHTLAITQAEEIKKLREENIELKKQKTAKKV